MKYILILAFYFLIQINIMAQDSHTQFHFSSQSILKNTLANEKLYGEYINNDNLSSGIYHLKKGMTDPQTPHQFDEIYYVMSGKAKLQIEGTVYPAGEGDLLFVPAKIPHLFIDIEEDLTVLVFFSKNESQ